MTTTETYLQKAWGDSIDNVTMEDVRTAISETIEMDDEHGAFWVGIVDDIEVVLEAHKDLTVFGVFSEDSGQQIKAKLQTWTEIEGLFKIFLSMDFDKVKSLLEANK